MIKTILLVGGGSCLGGITRYLLSREIYRFFPNIFPTGTMIVNIIGCLLIGLICGAGMRYSFMNEEMRAFLAIGFCGGFTTFSSFANENYLLADSGNMTYSILYSALSLVLCMAAVYIGYKIFTIH